MKKKIVLPIITVICSLILTMTLTCSRKSQLETIAFSGATMGSTFSIKIVDSKKRSSDYKESLKADINNVLSRVNMQMSTYLKESEISQFNSYTGTDWFGISEDLAKVLQKSVQVSQESGGAFDITIGPIVNLWGFGPEGTWERVPTPEEIESRLKIIGYKHLTTRSNPPAAKKELPGIYCDIGAIAPGFGVDQVAELFESKKIVNYMVEIGGEIRTAGTNAEYKPWRIGISTPDDKNGIEKVILLSNSSVSTSGDYRSYFEKDGVRYSHTMDPNTGKPITHKLASITVICKKCMDADAYATAIDVLGPEKGYEFAVKHKLPIFMLVKTADGFKEVMTPDFAAFLYKSNSKN
jgi:FAD:protein FMN transferase